MVRVRVSCSPGRTLTEALSASMPDSRCIARSAWNTRPAQRRPMELHIRITRREVHGISVPDPKANLARTHTRVEPTLAAVLWREAKAASAELAKPAEQTTRRGD